MDDGSTPLQRKLKRRDRAQCMAASVWYPQKRRVGENKVEAVGA